MQEHRLVVLVPFLLAHPLNLLESDVYDIFQIAVDFALHILQDCNDEVDYGYSVDSIAGATVDCETSADEMIYQGQVGFLLALLYIQHSIWVSSNIVFESNNDLIDILKTKSAFCIAITTCANEEQLRIQLPHLLGDRTLLVAMVQ